MPFPGIPAGSQAERKIDRCMESVMKRQRVDKSRAIAICMASIKMKGETYAPPAAVVRNAKRGLALRKKYKRGGLTPAQAGKQGIGSGIARARDIINGRLSLDTVKRMVNFFNRHEKNKDTPPDEGNGKISWLLWGGDAGRRWANGIVNRETTKDRNQAITQANYRDAGPSSTKTCGTCKFNDNGRCTLFKFKHNRNYLCDRWLPNIEALRERGRELTAEAKKSDGPIMAHGPGGLYSTLGASFGVSNAMMGKPSKKKRKRTKKEILQRLKRSRGPAEQRAMFAKMGASGSLRGKGPDGKRTIISIEEFAQQAKDGKMPKMPRGLSSEDQVRYARAAMGKPIDGRKPKKTRPKKATPSKKLRTEEKRISNSIDRYRELTNGIRRGEEGAMVKKLGNGKWLSSSGGGQFSPKVFRTRAEAISALTTHATAARTSAIQAMYAMARSGQRVNSELLKILTQRELDIYNRAITAQTTKEVLRTLKRSRGGPEQRAMFAKMGTAGSAYPRHGGKRMSPQQIERAEMKKWLDSLDTGGGNVEDKILPPKGKAPPGQGREYQTRRWIHGRIRKFEERKAQLQRATDSDRGTKRDIQRASRNSIAIDSINQSLEVARHVIQNLLDADMGFLDSKELFNELFTLPASLLGGL